MLDRWAVLFHITVALPQSGIFGDLFVHLPKWNNIYSIFVVF